MLIFYPIFLISLNNILSSKAGELRCLRPGGLVLSRFNGWRYFPGRVEALGETIDVTFDNGKQQSYTAYSDDVIVDDIPDVTELVPGTRVLSRRPNSVSFEPGFINGSIEGLNDTFVVNYEQGDAIARNLNDIRVATAPSNCMNEKGIYIGCFENVINTYLKNYYPVNPTDVATCNWACYARGFHFAGLQNGTWCFCGNHVNDSLKVDDLECNSACRDNRGDVCGGYQRMTIYWTGAETDDDGHSSTSSTTLDDGSSSNTGTIPGDGTTYDNAGTTTTQDTSSDSTTQDSSFNDVNAIYSNDTQCLDSYDSVQCNDWAEAERCIHDPDWMIPNCRKSCYACSYDNNNDDSSAIQTDQSATSTQSLYAYATAYQTPAPPLYQPTQAPSSSYEPAYNAVSSPVVDMTSVKKSEHPEIEGHRSSSYLGCFKDDISTHDMEYLADIKPLSIKGCITKCKSLRFPYAGLQSSTACYCGLHYGKYGEITHEDCNMPCEGDVTEMCGGMGTSSVYSTGFSSYHHQTENVNKRKMLPAPPVLGDVTSRSLFPTYQSPGFSSSQYQQSSYATNPGYATYNQASYSQTPATSDTTQATSFSMTSAQQRPTYKPQESSSYRWRESYVKLRAREQAITARNARKTRERSARLNKSRERNARLKLRAGMKLRARNARLKKLREKHKRTRKLRQKGAKVKERRKKHAKFHRHFHKSRKSRHFQHDFKEFPPSVEDLSKMSKYPHETTKKVRKIDKLTRIDKENGENDGNMRKPGIFLREKSSKTNNFLAFLPHEVTKDETMLNNVYKMLSLMLTNLRKKQKKSLKTLQRYLKLPKEQMKHLKHREEHKMERKNRKTHRKSINKTKQRSTGMVPGLAVRLKAMTSSGQKQPSNNVTSSHRSNQSAGDDLAGNPSYVYRVIIRPETPNSQRVVRLTNNTKIGLNFWSNHDRKNVSWKKIRKNHTLSKRKKRFRHNIVSTKLGEYRKDSRHRKHSDNSRKHSDHSRKHSEHYRKHAEHYRNATTSQSNASIGLKHRKRAPRYRNISSNHRIYKAKYGNMTSAVLRNSSLIYRNVSDNRKTWREYRNVSRRLPKNPERVPNMFNNTSGHHREVSVKTRASENNGISKNKAKVKAKDNAIIQLDQQLTRILNTKDNVIFDEKTDENILKEITKLLKIRNKRNKTSNHKIIKKSLLARKNKEKVENLMKDEATYEKHFKQY